MSSAFARRSSLTVLLIAGLLATACSSDDESSSDDSSSSATTVADENVTTTSPDPDSSQVSTTQGDGSTTSWDPSLAPSSTTPDLAAVAPMMLIQFGQAWADENWKAISPIADGAVVTTATDAHVPGAEPPITGDNVDGIIETCAARAEATIWDCQIEYDTTGFTMVLEQTPEGLRIIELAPSGAEGG